MEIRASIHSLSAYQSGPALAAGVKDSGVGSEPLGSSVDSCSLGEERSFIVSGLDAKGLQAFKSYVLANNERNQVEELPLIGGCTLALDAQDEVTLPKLEAAQEKGLLQLTPDGPRAMSISGAHQVQAASDVPQMEPLKDHNQLLGVETLHAQGHTGAGTCICILDTGIAPHPDLKDRIVAFKDFVNGAPLPYDDNGHGTHCAGIAAGDGRSSGGRYVGIAPEANIVGVKVLDRYNTGYDSNIIKGIQWAVDNKDRYGIDVLNLSLGHEIEESRFFDPLTRAVQKAVRKGLSVVVSAGNSGPAPGTVQSPGNAPKAITVAALNDNGTADRDDDFPASFSSCGPTKIDKLDKPDIAAPGVDIVSCAHDSANYVAMSGTSMAAPFTAGVVALLKEVQADLKPKEIKEAIMESAYQMPWQFQPHSLGAGVIDPPKAMEYIMRN